MASSLSSHLIIRKNKRSFSLVEILVALSLLVMTVAFLVVPGNRRLQAVRFNYAIREFKKRIEVIERTAAVSDTVLSLTMRFEKNQLVCLFEGSPLPLIIDGLIGAQCNGKSFQELDLSFAPRAGEPTARIVLKGASAEFEIVVPQRAVLREVKAEETF